MPEKNKKTRKSFTGAQFYQSEDERRKRREAGSGKTATETAIEDAINDAVMSGAMTPERAGKLSAEYFVDSVDDVYRARPAEYNRGGAVKKYKGGGKVRGYKGGGSVCRGGGAAVSGTKFSGVK